MTRTELLEEFSPAELKMAYRAILNKSIEEELVEMESPLLVFFFNTEKLDALYEYVEDQEYSDDPYFEYSCN